MVEIFKEKRRKSKLTGLTPAKTFEVNIISVYDSSTFFRNIRDRVNRVGNERVSNSRFVVNLPKERPSILTVKKNLARALENLV